MFKNKPKLIVGIVLLGLALLLLIGMIKYASVLGIFLVYSYVVEEITGLGLNSYLAKAIAIPIGIGLWYLTVKYFFSWWESKRLIGIIGLALFFVLHCLALFFISRDTLVNPVTGEVKFCTVHPYTGTIQPFEQSVFDKFGQKAEPCTNAQIEQCLRETEHGHGPLAEVAIDQVEQGFVSKVTGETLFFFCRDASGLPRFYPAKGYCPWGGELAPVTMETIKEFSAKQKERDNDKKQLDEFRQNNEVLVTANKRLEQLNAEWQKQNKQLTVEKADLENSLSAAQAQVTESGTRLADIEKRHETLIGEKSELAGVKRALESENGKLKRELDDTLKKADSLESSVDYYREKSSGCGVAVACGAAAQSVGLFLLVAAMLGLFVLKRKP